MAGIEVGSVYVSVLPSAKGFGPAVMKQVDKELRGARGVKTATQAGETAGKNIGKGVTRGAEQEVNKGFKGVFSALARQTANSGKSLTQITYGVNGIVPALTGAATSMGRFVSEASAINPVIAAGATAVAVATGAVLAYSAAVGVAAGAVGTWGVQEAANLELLKAQTSVLLGSKKGAADYMEFVLAIAKESIVSTDALLRAGRTFAAFGVDNVNNLKALVAQLNNFGAAAGLGVEQIDNLALALAQIYSLGRLQGQEVRQLSQVGVNSVKVLQELPKYAKMTTAEIKKAQEAGEISAADFFLAWQKFTQKYEGAAKETNNTVIGLFQQAIDTIKIGLGEAFTGGPLNSVKQTLKDIVEIIQSINFTPLASSIGLVIDAIRNAIFGTDGTSGINSIKQFFEVDLPTAIAGFSAFVGGVVAQIRAFITYLTAPFQVLFGAFNTAGSQATGFGVILGALSGIAAVTSFALLGVVTAVRAIAEGILQPAKLMMGVFNALRLAIQGDMEGAYNAIRDSVAGWNDIASDAAAAGSNIYNAFVTANSAALYAAAGAAAGSAWYAAFSANLPTDEENRARARDHRAKAKATPTLKMPKVPRVSLPKSGGGGRAKAKPTFNDSIDVSLGRSWKQIWKDALKFLENARKKGIEKSSSLYKQLAKDAGKLKVYAKARDRVTAALEREQKKLDALKKRYDDLRESIKNAMTSYANVGNALIPGINSARGFLSRLRNLAAGAKAYAAALLALKNAGASAALIEQVAALGVEQGTKVAKTLLAGGVGAIGEANSLVADVASVANTTSKTLADGLFAAGIAAAEGLIAGLKAKESALTKAMEKLAEKMLKAVKAKLGIASPSKVMAEVGGYTVDGFVMGLDNRAGQVAAAFDRVFTPGGATFTGGDIVAAPTVIYIGNERLNEHIDYRVERSQSATASSASLRRRV